MAGTTESKLEYLIRSKEDVRLAINRMLVPCPEDTPFLDYGPKIKQVDVDLSDATVTSDDLMEGVIAYDAKEQRLVGTIPDLGPLNFEPSDEEYIIPYGRTDGGRVNKADITKLAEYEACLTIANSVDNLEDYSNTTATAEDIALGKTAYSNGERIIGTADGINNNGYYEATGRNTFTVQTALSIIDFKNIDMTNVTSLNSCFKNTGVKIIKNLDTSNITDMNSTFNNCARLTAIPELNTSNVTDLSFCFQDCQVLTTIGTLDTSKVTKMSYLFSGCKALTEVPELDTSQVTNMYYMFGNCTKLEVIPELDYSLAVSVASMFSGCHNLKEIKGTLMNCGKATGTDYTFSQCYALETLPEIDFSASIRCYCTFQGCTSLKYVKIKLSNTVKNTQWMFDGCSALETVESSEDVMNLSGCTSVHQMFRSCPKLKNIPQFNLSSVTNIMGFVSSPELTDESLNNVMASCITATKASSKTLKNVGLSSAQATKCQSLSNWAAFSAAGWTTGY